MAKLPVIRMGNPLLRDRSQAVIQKDINTTDFQSALDDLIDTMRAENGAGIAAPQVGVLKRYFAIEIHNNPRYPDKETFALVVAINPVITPLSEEKVESWEGCLSIPQIRGSVARYTHIRLDALDRNGIAYSRELTGFPAIVAQHELDHLDGILYIDRMKDMTKLSFYEEYLTFWHT